MQILYSTANSLDKNRLRNLLCAPKGSLNLIRWDYRKNGLKYGENPDIRLKILPKYLNFSTSSVAKMMSKTGGVNEAEFIDSSTSIQPININQSGQIIGLRSDSIVIKEELSGSEIYSYTGLSNPSFAIQILNGNYFIANTNNDEVLEVSEDMSTLIDTISVSSPIFLDYLEDSDTLLVTTSGGTIYEYVRGSFILVWTSSTSFGDLKSATYSRKDVNRIVTADELENKIRVINKSTGSVVAIYSGFQNENGETDSFINPNMAIEFEDGSIAVIEKNGRVSDFETYTSSSSSSMDSSSTSSMTSSSLSSSSSSEGITSDSSSSSENFSESSSSSEKFSESSSSSGGVSESSSSENFSESSSSSSENFSESSSSEKFSESSSSSFGNSESSSSSQGVSESSSSVGYSESSSSSINDWTREFVSNVSRPSLEIYKGLPHITAYDLFTDIECLFSDGNWKGCGTIDAGALSKTKIVDKKLSTAYQQRTTWDLYYAEYLGGGSWATQLVKTSPTATSFSIQYFDLAEINCRPAIAYYDTEDPTLLQYAYYDGASWKNETIVTNLNGFAHVSMTEHNGLPVVVYAKTGGTWTLHYSIKSGESWTEGTIQASPTSLSFENDLHVVNGVLTCAYRYNAGADLKLNVATYNGTSWDIVEAWDDNSVLAGGPVSLTEWDQRPAIAYFSNSDDILYFIHYDGGNWLREVVDYANVTTADVEVLDGLPVIAYSVSTVTYFARRGEWPTISSSSESSESIANTSSSTSGKYSQSSFSSSDGYSESSSSENFSESSSSSENFSESSSSSENFSESSSSSENFSESSSSSFGNNQ
jgi:hypothetical protein